LPLILFEEFGILKYTVFAFTLVFCERRSEGLQEPTGAPPGTLCWVYPTLGLISYKLVIFLFSYSCSRKIVHFDKVKENQFLIYFFRRKNKRKSCNSSLLVMEHISCLLTHAMRSCVMLIIVYRSLMVEEDYSANQAPRTPVL